MRKEDIFDRVVSVSWLGWFRPIYYKYREMWLYALFGLGTVLINLFVYSLFTETIDLGVLVANAIAWIFATLFAFYTNRRWVFRSEAKGAKEIGREFAAFFGARVGTGLLDMLLMYLCVDLLGWNDMVMKLASNVIVVILNYVLSKFFIFKKKET